MYQEARVVEARVVEARVEEARAEVARVVEARMVEARAEAARVVEARVVEARAEAVRVGAVRMEAVRRRGRLWLGCRRIEVEAARVEASRVCVVGERIPQSGSVVLIPSTNSATLCVSCPLYN